MPEELVVVAKHGDKYIDECLKSLGNKYPIEVIDTSGGGHPTGAYIKAYRQFKAKNYFFMQDSMVALKENFLEDFEDCMAWGRFAFGFDNDEQRHWLEEQYSGEPPTHGIFGPVFYASRFHMKTLDKSGLFPKTPENKLQAQGTERAWAWAFKNAGIEVRGGLWDKSRMENGTYGIFKKTFGGRI